MRRFFQNPFVRLFLTLLLTVVFIVLFSAIAKFIVNLVAGGHLTTAPIIVLGESAYALSGILALLTVERLTTHRSLNALGIPLRSWPRDLIIGFGIGAGLFVTVFTLLWLSGNYALDTHPGTGAFGVLAGGLLLYLATAIFEEVLFRGILFHLIEEGAGSWVALIVTSLFFGLAHLANPNATIVSALAIALEAGLLLGALYMLTRNLWVVIGLHWAWNFFEGVFFGTPVSGVGVPAFLHATPKGTALVTGGSFGPEAGVVSVVILLVVGLMFIGQAIRTGRIIFFLPKQRAAQLVQLAKQ